MTPMFVVKTMSAAIAGSVLLASCAMQQEPCCATYPIKPFKAVYEQKMANGPATYQTWLSNGKGKVLISSGKGDPADRSEHATLIDYEKGETTTLDIGKKSAVPAKTQTAWISNGTMDTTNATALGDKTIDGHPCKGWKISDDNGKKEYWLGEDTGCYVLVSTVAPDHKTTEMKLVKYQPQLAAADLFEVPNDYTVTLVHN